MNFFSSMVDYINSIIKKQLKKMLKKFINPSMIKIVLFLVGK